MTAIERARARMSEVLNRPTPSLKQSASTVGVVAALLVIAFVPGVDITAPLLAWSAVGMVAFATVLAVIATRVRAFDRYVLIIPVIDIFAFGAFRGGTGGNSSAFVALIILPMVWLASGNGRRFIVYSFFSTALALLIPVFVGVASPGSSAELARGIFTPLALATAAAIINELARQGRERFESTKVLADDKERMLQSVVEFAAKLQESEAKYRRADRMFSGVWAAITEQSMIGTDATGLIDAWNPGATKILGPTADEAEDIMHIFDFHLPEELENHARELNYPPGETVLNPGFSALVERARLGEADSGEWTYVRSDGSHVPVQLSVTKRVDEEGATVGYLFVASDVTQAREVARLKDEFVGLISHELRTPLSSILGYLELLRDDEDEPLSLEQLKYLSVAERNAHRLLRLVGDLLFTAQVESGKFPLDARDTDLEAIIVASLETATPTADAAGIALVNSFPPGPVIVHGDATRLGQAVDNLVSNAVKFTPRGGTVSVNLAVVDERAVIAVRDTGMGIPESELDMLFSRFFRATTATRNAVPGVGLGLTITKAIVNAHSGEMSVRSEEGVGTEFSVTLPLSNNQPSG